mmetsp:Transcript_32727/g.79535  ORF Transcript_32727/g.79535 Transcript_32727/m.79535 type:complete len:96 (-) Transcript_32727:217-504(-)
MYHCTMPWRCKNKNNDNEEYDFSDRKLVKENKKRDVLSGRKKENVPLLRTHAHTHPNSRQWFISSTTTAGVCSILRSSSMISVVRYWVERMSSQR